MAVNNRCPKCCGMVSTDIFASHVRNCNGERQTPKRVYPMDICPECGVNAKLRRVRCCWRCEIKDPDVDWARLELQAKAEGAAR